jgi:putative hydrolase of the HAD superfamily
MSLQRENRCILFDWGDTLMRVFPDYDGPMVTWPKVEAMPHAVEVLTDLHRKFLLGVATNAGASEEAEIRAALEQVGLNQLLERVYCYRRIGHKKPSMAFFDYILADLGVDASQVIMVGDDFEADVIGANNCSIRAVWYNPLSANDHESSMHRTIHDLRVLPQVLEAFWKPVNEK